MTERIGFATGVLVLPQHQTARGPSSRGLHRWDDRAASLDEDGYGARSKSLIADHHADIGRTSSMQTPVVHAGNQGASGVDRRSS